jgi:hypothetical protein
MDDASQSDFTALADAIADLPERERLVFTLYYYEELVPSEIALVTGETSFAVVQLHVSALSRLKAQLADPENRLPKPSEAYLPHKPSTVVWTQEQATQAKCEPSYWGSHNISCCSIQDSRSNLMSSSELEGRNLSLVATPGPGGSSGRWSDEPTFTGKDTGPP